MGKEILENEPYYFVALSSLISLENKGYVLNFSLNFWTKKFVNFRKSGVPKQNFYKLFYSPLNEDLDVTYQTPI